MKMRLKNLRLKRVSLVNDPANEEALVVLFKSNDKPAEEVPVTKDDDVDAGMTSCKGCKSKMSKGAKFCPGCGDKVAMKGAGMELDKLDPEVRKAFEKLQADLKEANDKLAAAPAPVVEKKADADVLKELSPAAREMVEKANAIAADSAAKVKVLSDAIEKANDENLEKAFVEEAKTYRNIGGDPKVLGPILKRVSLGKTTKEDLAALQGILKGANAAAKPLLTVVGGSERGGNGSAFAEIDALVKEVISKAGEKKPTYSDALDIVAKEHPALYSRYRDEASSHAPAVAAGEEE